MRYMYIYQKVLLPAVCTDTASKLRLNGAQLRSHWMLMSAAHRRLRSSSHQLFFNDEVSAVN